MRVTLIAAVAAGFVAVLGFAFAQEPQQKNEPAPAPQSLERGARVEGGESRPKEAATGAASNEDQAAPPNAARKVNPQDVHSSGNANLSQESVARIATALNATATPRHISVDVDVGGLLPGNVDVKPLPPSVAEVVPEYKGYHYVVANDDIFIVQPSTRRVVEVISQGERPTR